MDGPINYIFSDVENAFGRWRYVLAWTPFGPVLLIDDETISELTLPPYL